MQPEQLSVDEHLARATRLAAIAVEHGNHGFGDTSLAYATTAQVHVSIAQVLTAREALAAAHAPVEAEPIPGSALARIHAALAEPPP
ncbi:hypothetical protein [Terrabacter terrigena]|uniref:DUF222 domain-containing protein n=1 Tax=Terrabacter terrigena TaxID=574718 RepID=A0ABW3MYA7_9MICO